MAKYFFYLFLILHVGLYSQNIGSINGKVTDSESGLPLEGATVIVENSNFFTVTDENGYFQIPDLPTTSYNVTARFIGFKSQTKFNVIVKSVGNQSLDYTLRPMNELLDDGFTAYRWVTYVKRQYIKYLNREFVRVKRLG